MNYKIIIQGGSLISQKSTFLLISSELPEQLFDQLGKRKDEHSRKNIGNAVNGIEHQARR